MKLQEISHVNDIDGPRVNYDEVDIENSTVVFKVDGHPVYELKQKDGGSARLLKMLINNEEAAVVGYDSATLHGKPCLYINRAFTHSKFKGNGYALKLILQLKRTTKKSLIGDQQMTSAGFDMWLKMSTYLNVRVLDRTNLSLHPIENIDREKLFMKDEKGDHQRYLFVAEQEDHQHLSPEFVLPEQDSGIVKSYAFILIEDDEQLRNV